MSPRRGTNGRADAPPFLASDAAYYITAIALISRSGAMLRMG
jgi:hypothetical protein